MGSGSGIPTFTGLADPPIAVPTVAPNAVPAILSAGQNGQMQGRWNHLGCSRWGVSAYLYFEQRTLHYNNRRREGDGTVLAPVVQRHLPDVSRICQQERIDSLAVFGSATRNDFREESDIDLVVQFAPGQRVGFVRLLSIQDRLSEIFEGRAVDMHTLREIHPVIRGQVQHQMVSTFHRSSKPNGGKTCILPGYITRLPIGRRIALPQLDSVQLVLQSLTISFVLDTFVLLLWMDLAAFYTNRASKRSTVPQLSTAPDLLVLVTAVALVFATGIIIVVWESKFTDFIIQAVVTTGGTIRVIPMFYYLFSERPKLFGPNSQSWVDVEMTWTSKGIVIVRVYRALRD